MSKMSTKRPKTFEQIQLADGYTRSIVFGYIRDISCHFTFTIPSIIYELCVSFYYAGEHFAYLGYDMFITSENDNQSLKTYNNVIEMTSDDKWNTCYGQVNVDTKLKISYIYQWIFVIHTSSVTSIGFGVSTEYERSDDAFWITQSNPHAKYYSFTASINTAQKLALLSSSSSNWITYDQTLSDQDKIKLVLNVKKKTLQCIINDKKSSNIIVHNIETNKLKYHLSISMCGRYSVRLLDFQRIIYKEKHSTQHNASQFVLDYKHFGDIEIGILSKSQQQHRHRRRHRHRHHYNTYDSDEDTQKVCYKEGDILTLKKIIYDYQSIKTLSSRKQLITEFAQKKMQISEFTTTEEVYGLVELIILLVIRNRYKDNVIFTQTYFKDVSEFVEWIFYDENNMDSSSWPIQQFAQKFDDWLSKVIN
eukprot:138756_1